MTETVEAYNVPRGAAYFTSQQLVSYLASFLFYITLARLLTRDEIGQVSLLAATLAIFNTITQLALPATATRYISSSLGRGQPDTAGAVVRTTLRAASLLAAAGGTVALILSPSIGPAVFGTDATALLVTTFLAGNIPELSLRSPKQGTRTRPSRPRAWRLRGRRRMGDGRPCSPTCLRLHVAQPAPRKGQPPHQTTARLHTTTIRLDPHNPRTAVGRHSAPTRHTRPPLNHRHLLHRRLQRQLPLSPLDTSLFGSIPRPLSIPLHQQQAGRHRPATDSLPPDKPRRTPPLSLTRRSLKHRPRNSLRAGIHRGAHSLRHPHANVDFHGPGRD